MNAKEVIVVGEVAVVGRSDGMPLLTEFRILMPLTMQEYEIGHRFSVAQASLAETGGGEGIEVKQNRGFANFPLLGGRYNSGQYTQKLYHLKSKVPAVVKMVAPSGSLTCLEESWNCYPYCKTVFTNPGYMKKDMCITVETMHLADGGQTQNALFLTPQDLAARKVVYLDIADDQHLNRDDKKPETDPRKFKSHKIHSSRTPLKAEWTKENLPLICCYKLVRVQFKMPLLGGYIERKIMELYPRGFTKVNREAFCSLDQWYHLNIRRVCVSLRNTSRKFWTDRGRKAPSEGLVHTPQTFIVNCIVQYNMFKWSEFCTLFIILLVYMLYVYK